MKTESIQYESEAFSCEQKDKFAVLTLQKQALEIATNLEVRKNYSSVLSAIEQSPEVVGLVQINSTEYPGDEEYREFLESVMGGASDRRELSVLYLKRLERSMGQLTLKAANFTKPLIAGLKGNITVEYLGLTLPFDFRIAAQDTTFTFTNLKLGFPPSGPLAFYLLRYVGHARALEILLSGKSYSASETLELGLVTEVVPHDELEQRCLEKLEELSKSSSLAVAATRRLLRPEPAELELFLQRSFDGVWSALTYMNK